MDSPQQGIPILPTDFLRAEPLTHLAKPGSRGRGRLLRIEAGTQQANQTCAPVTLRERSPASQSCHNSSDGGVVIKPPEASTAPFHADDECLPSFLPASPSRIANICIRRTRHGSALLQSPARAGHAARMRQIFEDAGREHNVTLADGGILYPRLPNISRKASPLPNHSRHPLGDDPSSSYDHVDPVLAVPNCADQHPLEQTSGSWSDDSGYFIADGRGCVSALTSSPRERIYSWLQNISLVDTDDDEAVPTRPSQLLASDEANTTGRINNEEHMFQIRHSLKAPNLLEDCQSSDKDSFICEDLSANLNPFLESTSIIAQGSPTLFRSLLTRTADMSRPVDVNSPSRRNNNVNTNNHAFTTAPSLPTPGISNRGVTSSNDQVLANEPLELSPLSPNVCIERGPSRYHTNRRSIYAGSPSPIKAPPRTLISTPQLQENSGPREERMWNLGSPLASHRRPVGKRF